MNNKYFKRKRRVDTNIKYHLDSWTCWTYLLCFNIRLYRFLCKWQPKINCWSETTVNHYYSNFHESSINFQYNLIYYLEFNNKNSCLALKINSIKHKKTYISVFSISLLLLNTFLNWNSKSKSVSLLWFQQLQLIFFTQWHFTSEYSYLLILN